MEFDLTRVSGRLCGGFEWNRKWLGLRGCYWQTSADLARYRDFIWWGHAFSGLCSGNVQVRDKGTGGWENVVMDGLTSWVVLVKFVDDRGRILAGSHDGTVRVWVKRQGKQKYTEFVGCKKAVCALVVTENGKRIFFEAREGDVHVWDRGEGDWKSVEFGGLIGEIMCVCVMKNRRRIIGELFVRMCLLHAVAELNTFPFFFYVNIFFHIRKVGNIWGLLSRCEGVVIRDVFFYKRLKSRTLWVNWLRMCVNVAQNPFFFFSDE